MKDWQKDPRIDEDLWLRKVIHDALDDRSEISSDFTERVMAEVDRFEVLKRKSRREVTRFWRTHLGSAALVAGVFGLIFVNVVSVISGDRSRRSETSSSGYGVARLTSASESRSSVFGESRDSVFAESQLPARGLYYSVLVSRGSQIDDIKMAIDWRRGGFKSRP